MCARKVVADNGFSPIGPWPRSTTPPRVGFLKSRFPDSSILRQAQTPVAVIDVEKQKEARSLRVAKAKLGEIPHSCEQFWKFYEASAHDQKHYDTVSLAAVTGAIIITGLLFQSALTNTSAITQGRHVSIRRP